jgi:hypothetical protein
LQFLGAPEDVPIEPDRFVIVVDLHNQSHLQYARLPSSYRHSFRLSDSRESPLTFIPAAPSDLYPGGGG